MNGKKEGRIQDFACVYILASRILALKIRENCCAKIVIRALYKLPFRFHLKMIYKSMTNKQTMHSKQWRLRRTANNVVIPQA